MQSLKFTLPWLYLWETCLADSRIIPLDLPRLNHSLHQAQSSFTSISASFPNDKRVLDGLSAVKRSLREFTRACDSFVSAVIKTSSKEEAESVTLQALNNQLTQVGKAFIDSRVLNPNPDVFQHVLSAGRFSGVSNAVKSNDTSKIQEQLSILSVAISTAGKILQPIRIPSEE